MKRILIAPHVMPGVRAWFEERVGKQPLTQSERWLAEANGTAFAWWLPSGELRDSQPVDEKLRYFAMPMPSLELEYSEEVIHE